MDYKICWLTVNRACNLQCIWCYAKNTKYLKKDDMPLSMAKDIIDICKDLGIGQITLIGGEPSIYPYLKEVIEYCNKSCIKCGMVTNGVKLADKKFVQELKDLGQESMSISLKGENRQVYYDITGRDKFEETKIGVKNCLDLGLRVSVSMVLTEKNIETFLEGIKTFKELGVKYFNLSFCYEFDTSREYKEYLSNNNPKVIVDKFMKIYPELDRITEGRFSLFETFPLCLWDRNFIKMMVKKHQIRTVCQLLHKSGLIFDSKGNIIPCNAMPDIKFGKLYEDFNNSEELLKYVENKDIQDAYKTLCSVPDKICLSCKDYKNCGGGCVCHWTNYDFKTLMELKK